MATWSFISWLDRIVQYPRRYLDELSAVKTFTPNEGTVTQAGTPFSAANMNILVQGIQDAINQGSTVHSATVSTGAISVTISNYVLKTNDVLTIVIASDATGTVTLNVNAGGAKSVKDNAGTAITQLSAGIWSLRYTGTEFRLVGVADEKGSQPLRGIKHDTGNSLPTTGWSASSTDYEYEYDFADSDITINDIVIVTIDKNSMDDAEDCVLASVVDSYAGGITFYAYKAPGTAITFDYLVVKG